MKTHSEPLVSVIMPVYNGEKYIEAAVNSILNQSYQNIELLILDNGSTDGTHVLIEQIMREDKRLKSLHISKPLGYGGEVASNVAASKAKGTFIAKLDADDIAKPERIAKQVSFLLSNPTIFMVGSNIELIDKEGKKIGIRTYPSNNQDIYSEFYLRCPIANPSVMYRNILTEDMYKIRFPHFNDYYSLFLLINQGKKQFYNIQECLTLYRIHDNNTVFTNLREKWKVNVDIKNCFIKEFGYVAPFHHLAKIALVTTVINLLPERLLIKVMNKSRQLIKV